MKTSYSNENSDSSMTLQLPTKQVKPTINNQKEDLQLDEGEEIYQEGIKYDSCMFTIFF